MIRRFFQGLLPFVGVLAARSRTERAAHVVSLAAIVGLGAYHAQKGRIPPAYALTLPLTPLLLAFVMLRSAWVTQTSGGITWRGTFYPLDKLRERAVPPEPAVLKPA